MGNKTVKCEEGCRMEFINKAIKDYINEDKSPSFYFKPNIAQARTIVSIKDFNASKICEASIHIINTLFSQLIYKEVNSTIYFPLTVITGVDEIKLSDNIIWIDHFVDKFIEKNDKDEKVDLISISSIPAEEVDSLNLFYEKTIETKKFESDKILRFNFIDRVFNRKSEKRISKVNTILSEKSKGALFVRHIANKQTKYIQDSKKIDM